MTTTKSRTPRQHREPTSLSAQIICRGIIIDMKLISCTVLVWSFFVYVILRFHSSYSLFWSLPYPLWLVVVVVLPPPYPLSCVFSFTIVVVLVADYCCFLVLPLAEVCCFILVATVACRWSSVLYVLYVPCILYLWWKTEE